MADETPKEIKAAPIAHIELRKDIAAQLAGTGTKIRTMVVDQLVEEEIKKRKDAVLSLLSKIKDKEIEIRKAESSGEKNFNLQGDPVGEPTFTKQQLEDIKKLRESLDKMQMALSKAFESGDFTKLLELVK